VGVRAIALDRNRGQIASGGFDPSELDPKALEAGVLLERALDLYVEYREAIRRAFPGAVRAAKLDYGHTRHGVTFHSLRRTAASLALNAGVPEHVVQKLGN
jgi:integrase